MNTSIRMQPLLTQSANTINMDLSNGGGVGSAGSQPMDWLLQKESTYLLAQFWQQVSSSTSFSHLTTHNMPIRIL